MGVIVPGARGAAPDLVSVTIRLHPKTAETLERMGRAQGNVSKADMAQRLFDAAFAVRCGVVKDPEIAMELAQCLPTTSQAKASTGNGATERAIMDEAPANSVSGEVIRPVAGRSATATSEPMDATAGETAPLITRAHCDRPQSCDAKGPRLCRRCNMRVTAQRRHGERVRTVPIPAWVPPDLHEDYRDAAIEQGEEYAASLCRRLKAEASR